MNLKRRIEYIVTKDCRLYSDYKIILVICICVVILNGLLLMNKFLFTLPANHFENSLDIFTNKFESEFIKEFSYLKHINYYGNLTVSKQALCHIQSSDIWDAKIKNLMKKTPVYNQCKKNSPLTFVWRNQLFIDNKINLTIFNGQIKYCQMAKVLRKTVFNDNYTLGIYKQFKNGIKIVADFVKVRCLNFDDEIVYEYVHPFIQNKKQSDRNESFSKSSKKPKFNVVFLIIDAVSAASFRRALPLSLAFLKKHENFFMFKKHHITGENTFENLVPMLTNLNSNRIPQSSENTTVPPYDDYPFIWKKFHERSDILVELFYFY